MDQGCNLSRNRERACVLNLRGRILPKGQENHERELTRHNLRKEGRAVNRQFSRNSGGTPGSAGDGDKNDDCNSGAEEELQPPAWTRPPPSFCVKPSSPKRA